MTTPSKKPPADFLIRLVAPGLKPWGVSTRNLSRILDAVQRLVQQTEEETLEEETAPIRQDLTLLDVRLGSALYKISVASPGPALKLITETGRAINEAAHSAWTQPTLSSIQELSEVARSIKCQLELCEPGSEGKPVGDIIAKIGPSTYEHISAAAFISGTTSVFARIERVGGAVAPHCGIRLRDQPRKMVICHLASERLARDLGPFIYQDVFLSGHATWLRHSMQIRSFTINSFEPPKTGSIRDALKRIHAAGGNAWDKVKDPDAVLSEMRGHN